MFWNDVLQEPLELVSIAILYDSYIKKKINTKIRVTRPKVICPDGEPKILDILAGVLQGDTIAPYFVHYHPRL